MKEIKFYDDILICTKEKNQIWVSVRHICEAVGTVFPLQYTYLNESTVNDEFEQSKEFKNLRTFIELRNYTLAKLFDVADKLKYIRDPNSLILTDSEKEEKKLKQEDINAFNEVPDKLIIWTMEIFYNRITRIKRWKDKIADINASTNYKILFCIKLSALNDWLETIKIKKSDKSGKLDLYKKECKNFITNQFNEPKKEINYPLMIIPPSIFSDTNFL